MATAASRPRRPGLAGPHPRPARRARRRRASTACWSPGSSCHRSSSPSAPWASSRRWRCSTRPARRCRSRELPDILNWTGNPINIGAFKLTNGVAGRCFAMYASSPTSCARPPGAATSTRSATTPTPRAWPASGSTVSCSASTRSPDCLRHRRLGADRPGRRRQPQRRRRRQPRDHHRRRHRRYQPVRRPRRG